MERRSPSSPPVPCRRSSVSPPVPGSKRWMKPSSSPPACCLEGSACISRPRPGRDRGGVSVGSTLRFDGARARAREAAPATLRGAPDLIHAESGSLGRELEEHATRLVEVDGLEPEPVDHRGGPAGSCLDLCSQRELMRLVLHAPCEMVDRATPHMPRLASGPRRHRGTRRIRPPRPRSVPSVLASAAGSPSRPPEMRWSGPDRARGFSRRAAPDLMLRRDGTRLGWREGAARGTADSTSATLRPWGSVRGSAFSPSGSRSRRPAFHSARGAPPTSGRVSGRTASATSLASPCPGTEGAA